MLERIGIALLLFFFAVAGGLTPLTARSAPKAQSAQECEVIVDMSVVAAAMPGEVERPLAERIMKRIYDLSPKGEVMMDALLTAAYRDRPDPRLFADELMKACMRSGDMDGILGKDV